MKRIEYIEKTNTLIGTKRKELIDKETGEIIEVDQITKKIYGQKNFWKLYLSDFLHVLGGIENKQVAILKYILDNTPPSTNLFIGTYKTIQKNTHTSETTIAKVMKKLQNQKFLVKIQNGLWQKSIFTISLRPISPYSYLFLMDIKFSWSFSIRMLPIHYIFYCFEFKIKWIFKHTSEPPY